MSVGLGWGMQATQAIRFLDQAWLVHPLPVQRHLPWLLGAQPQEALLIRCVCAAGRGPWPIEGGRGGDGSSMLQRCRLLVEWACQSTMGFSMAHGVSKGTRFCHERSHQCAAVVDVQL